MKIANQQSLSREISLDYPSRSNVTQKLLKQEEGRRVRQRNLIVEQGQSDVKRERFDVHGWFSRKRKRSMLVTSRS